MPVNKAECDNIKEDVKTDLKINLVSNLEDIYKIVFSLKPQADFADDPHGANPGCYTMLEVRAEMSTLVYSNY